MDTSRIAENANVYILHVNNEKIRTFRKNVWTRKEVSIYRIGYLRGLRATKVK